MTHAVRLPNEIGSDIVPFRQRTNCAQNRAGRSAPSFQGVVMPLAEGDE